MRILVPSAIAVALISNCLSSNASAQSPGTVQAWGFNAFGEVGDGTTTDRYAPVGASGLTGVSAVSAGEGHSLALLTNGSVRAWGLNTSGQLGNGTLSNSRIPVPVSGLSGVVSIAAGGAHSLALLGNGTVCAWGGNSFGQLGSGSTSNSLFPVSVAGLVGAPGSKDFLPGSFPRVVSVSAGKLHSLALLSDGTVRAWGNNSWGQLGNGSMVSSSAPVAVTGLTGVIAISAGAFHNLALRLDGTVWAWGLNAYGESGAIALGGANLTPVQVSGVAGVTSISAGALFSIALLSDHTVRAWGNNFGGQLGNGTRTDSPVPVPVIGLSTVTAIDGGMGQSHGLALLADGTVWGWGVSDGGMLGTGPAVYVTVPAPVLNLAGVVAISAGDHDLAIVNPQVTIDPAGLDFGGIGFESTTTGMVTITNRGPGPLTITDLQITGANAADFTIVNPGLPYTIPSGLSGVFSLNFRPSGVGVRSAALRIVDTGFQSPHTVTLSGEGLPTADVAVSISAVPDLATRTITYTVTVINFGPTVAPDAVFSLPRSTTSFGEPLSITPSQGSCARGFGGLWHCLFGDLAAGALATARVRVPISATSPTYITYSVTSSAESDDPNIGNNTATAVTYWMNAK